MITTVNQELVTTMVMSYILMILSGMVRTDLDVTLNETVNDDIELISCGYDQGFSYFGGTPFDLVELYIK